MSIEEFYGDLLSIDLPWQVSLVEIDKPTQNVKIHLSHIEQSRFKCKSCGHLCSVYDHQPKRIWRHLDTCHYETYVIASLPRVNCSCGIRTIEPSWSREQSRFTLLFESHAIDVLQQTQVVSRSALLLKITESQLRTIRDTAVKRGLNRRMANTHYVVAHLCIDEKSLHQGHHYVSILYNGSTGAVLEVIEHRTEKAVLEAFSSLGMYIDLTQVQVITMDMWSAFKTAAQKSLANADIVHDRFHLSQYLNKAVDITRRAENKILLKEEDDTLKGTRYIWLKNEENLSEYQQLIKEELFDLNEAKDLNLKTIQVWHLKEEFKAFFKSSTQEEAMGFFKEWKLKVTKLGNKALMKVCKTFENHLEHLITYAKYKVSNAMAESINTSIQLLKAKAKGFYSAQNFRTNILFHFGKMDLYP